MNDSTLVTIKNKGVTLENLIEVATFKKKVEISNESLQKVKTSRDYIEKKLTAGQLIYGVNTGFGAFSSVKISPDQIEKLQINLIRSHAVGVGPFFSKEQTRAMMFLRASTLAQGLSGIRPEPILKLIEFLNHDIIPKVPSQGSVGASGDLAPLAHIALGLIGEGQAWSSDNNHSRSMKDLLQEKGVTPLQLQAKEGLSLINGCQVMTALGLLSLKKAIHLVQLADAIGALTVEVLKGSRSAFDPLLSAARPHEGEIKTASNLRALLNETSEIGQSHLHCDRVQDAYSLRCMPAVHGAVKDTLRYLEKVLLTEANSSTDNPLVFSSDDKILSCGNFHGMPVALALDYATISLTTLGSISEQRLAKLINPAMNIGLPAFLAPEGGLNSGHMITHVVSAALTSENKVLSHPASCDSIPTSADKEDHVSMGTIAARKLDQVIQNVSQILANELLSGTQALDILRPLKSSPPLEHLHHLVREHVPFAPEDRHFGEDILKLNSLIENDWIIQNLKKMVTLNW